MNFWEKEHILYVYSCIHISLYIQQTFCFANCDIKQLTLYMIDFGKPLKL